MKKLPKNKEAIYLRKKIELYETFLFGYLPQITALSYVTRFTIYDAFGPFGTDRFGSQGSPNIIFEAMRKQRQHQLQKKLPLKPLSLSLLHPLGQSKTYLNILENLQLKNSTTNSCKIDSWPLPTSQAFARINRQRQQQPGSEKHLLMLDPVGIPEFSLPELLLLAGQKVEIILCLPLRALWQLHSKPGKEFPLPEIVELKRILDNSFPAEHPYWSVENEAAHFKEYLKEPFSNGGKFFTALEPADMELPEVALLTICSDAFMMEKLLYALQSLRSGNTPPAGQQLGIFGSAPKPASSPGFSSGEDIPELLKEEKDNQQLYAQGLRSSLLPAQLMNTLQSLLKNGALEMWDEKKKPIADIPANCLSYTAYKAAKPVCYFRLIN